MTPKPGAALLFDIDGTLADTDEFHRQAFNEVFGPRGEVFDPDRFTREIQGFANSAIAERLLTEETPVRRIEIMAEKEAVFRRLVRGHVRPKAGLMALLNRADEAEIPMAAVTNAPRLNAEMMLNGLGIAERFRSVIIADELSHGKPHPLPYLEGLRALNARADCSLAFEDSRSGIRSAASAGLATIGLATSLSHEQIIAAGAVVAVNDFLDPKVATWLRQRLDL